MRHWLLATAVLLWGAHALAQNTGRDDSLLDASLQDSPVQDAPATTATATPSSPQARGVLRARDRALLSSELSGRLLEIPFTEGQAFNKGDVLVRFDCGAYQAQLGAAQAAAQGAKEEFAHNQQLAAMNSVGRFEVARAQARLAEAQAQAQFYQVQVKRCVISAPFSGRVVQRKVQPFESVAAGAPLVEIVDNRTLEIHLLVPSRWASKLKPGEKFAFTPDETGKPLQARIERLGARIDEGSQTLLLIASLPNLDGLLAGMSGSARFGDKP